jgi:hypothetical protein
MVVDAEELHVSDFSLVLKCTDCKWEWVGKRRRNPKRPDPKELRTSLEAWRSHMTESGHHVPELSLREHLVFRFASPDAPSLEDVLVSSDGTGRDVLARLQRLQAVGERRKMFRKQRRSRSSQ